MANYTYFHNSSQQVYWKSYNFSTNTITARTFFVRAVSVSIIHQLKLLGCFYRCFASIHLPCPFPLVFVFPLLDYTVLWLPSFPAMPSFLLQQNANQSAIAFIEDPGQRGLHLFLRVWRHLMQLALKPFLDELLQ